MATPGNQWAAAGVRRAAGPTALAVLASLALVSDAARAQSGLPIAAIPTVALEGGTVYRGAADAAWLDDEAWTDDLWAEIDAAPRPAPEPLGPPTLPPTGGQRPEPAPEPPRNAPPRSPRHVARIRSDGKASIPPGAPKRVRSLIIRYNQIVGKPYKWGGGHGRLVDSGYDCSGTVGYALVKGGLLGAPTTSGGFMRWARPGTGRWVTVYAHASHVYVVVAGLRLDTSAVGDPGAGRGPRWRPMISRRSGFVARHPAGL